MKRSALLAVAALLAIALSMSAAVADDTPSSTRQRPGIADMIAATPNSENVFATSPKHPVVLHVQSGIICQAFYFTIKLVRLSVDDTPPVGERASCWFKSKSGGDRPGDIVLSAEHVTSENAKDPRGDAIAAFLRTHSGSHTERSYVEFNNRLVVDGHTYEPGIANFTFKTDDGTKMTGKIWIGIVQDWIISIQLTEPDGETRPDEPLLAILWVDEAGKVLAAHKLRQTSAQPASP
jgi:hypothetical protein